LNQLLQLSVAVLSLVLSATASEPSRSYVYSGNVSASQCDILPRATFEILPSLDRAGSADRLTISCNPIDDDRALLKLIFLLADAPAALAPGQSRTYSFRWGAKIIPDKAHLLAGEFTRDEAKCERIRNLLTQSLDANHPDAATWTAGCYGEDLWGMAMEITLTEASPVKAQSPD
jgi:hypothetical protein